MKANNDDIKCHLKKISSCEHYGYLMDCPLVTLLFLSAYVWLFPPPPPAPPPHLITWLNVRRQLLTLLGQNIVPYSG